MKKLIFISLLLVYPLISWAEWEGHRHYPNNQFRLFWQSIFYRQQNQDFQIDSAIQAGLLTRSEIRKLRHQQNQLTKQINRYKRHHFIDFDDKQCIREHLDHISNEINRMTQGRHYIGTNQSYISYPPRIGLYQRFDDDDDDDDDVGLYFRF